MEKLQTMVKREGYFEEKERFHIFKSLLFKNGTAQNFVVVAGHLFEPFQLPSDFKINMSYGELRQSGYVTVSNQMKHKKLNLKTCLYVY